MPIYNRIQYSSKKPQNWFTAMQSRLKLHHTACFKLSWEDRSRKIAPTWPWLNVDTMIIFISCYNLSEGTWPFERTFYLCQPSQTKFPWTSFVLLFFSLYELGLHPQPSNLYPKVEYPVSSGTKMISPLVEWEHSEDWWEFNIRVYIIFKNIWTYTVI